MTNPGNHVVEILLLALTGLGISLAPIEFVGGMFLASSGSLIAIRQYPTARAKSFWAALFGGIFVAVIVAEIIQANFFQQYVGGVPVQAIMGVSGYLSSWILRLMARVGDRAEEKVPEKIIPEED